jgi:exodeoxyribonuclease-3
MKIATWNINSVRLRIDSIINFLNKKNIDVICLQETKTENKSFPLDKFEKNGLIYSNINGQKSYNGVAILSKLPFLEKKNLIFCGKNDSRHVSVKFYNNIILHNFYVPAGGDIPDPVANPKFKHKLDFLNEMTNYFQKEQCKKRILVGDLNIAPGEYDVWSHKQLLNVVSYTSIEREKLKDFLERGAWFDIVRLKNSPDKKLFSWWSYRSKDWKDSNRGRRLDHIFSSSDITKKVKKVEICKELRGIDKPSDHAPIIVDIKI